MYFGKIFVDNNDVIIEFAHQYGPQYTKEIEKDDGNKIFYLANTKVSAFGAEGSFVFSSIDQFSSILISPEAKEMLQFLLSKDNTNLKEDICDIDIELFKYNDEERGIVIYPKNENYKMTFNNNMLITIDSDCLDIEGLDDMTLCDNEILKNLDFSEPIDEKEFDGKNLN